MHSDIIFVMVVSFFCVVSCSSNLESCKEGTVACVGKRNIYQWSVCGRKNCRFSRTCWYASSYYVGQYDFGHVLNSSLYTCEPMATQNQFKKKRIGLPSTCSHCFPDGKTCGWYGEIYAALPICYRPYAAVAKAFCKSISDQTTIRRNNYDHEPYRINTCLQSFFVPFILNKHSATICSDVKQVSATAFGRCIQNPKLGGDENRMLSFSELSVPTRIWLFNKLNDAFTEGNTRKFKRSWISQLHEMMNYLLEIETDNVNSLLNALTESPEVLLFEFSFELISGINGGQNMFQIIQNIMTKKHFDWLKKINLFGRNVQERSSDVVKTVQILLMRKENEPVGYIEFSEIGCSLKSAIAKISNSIESSIDGRKIAAQRFRICRRRSCHDKVNTIVPKRRRSKRTVNNKFAQKHITSYLAIGGREPKFAEMEKITTKVMRDHRGWKKEMYEKRDFTQTFIASENELILIDMIDKTVREAIDNTGTCDVSGSSKCKKKISSNPMKYLQYYHCDFNALEYLGEINITLVNMKWSRSNKEWTCTYSENWEYTLGAGETGSSNDNDRYDINHLHTAKIFGEAPCE